MTLAAKRIPWVLLGCALTALAILIGLGSWQLQRRAEKSAFIAQLRAEALATPRDGWPRPGEAARELGRFTLQGEYVAGSQAYVRVTVEPLGLALYVITPLKLDDGRVVLVNRGAVRANVDGGPRAASVPPAGRIRITGFRRMPEKRWRFSAVDDPARLIFAVRDPALIGQALQVPADASALLELERTGAAADAAAPLATQAEALIARIPNDHLNYALTWFGLALTLLGVLIAFLIRKQHDGESRLPKP
ncbi:MAG: SURF1 family protein [Bosea sp. (in: a-proteobacteria)]